MKRTKVLYMGTIAFVSLAPLTLLSMMAAAAAL